MNRLSKKNIVLIIILLLIITVGVTFKLINDKETVPDNAALMVNNTVITHQEFDNIVKQTRQELQMYGIKFTERELREEAIDRAIQRALILEHANERGIKVTQEEIDEGFYEIMAMYNIEKEEDFLAQLEAEGINSRKEVDVILTADLKINKLVDLYMEEVEITDEELENAYNEYVLQMREMMDAQEIEEDIPSFEEMKEYFKEKLVAERMTSRLLAKIEELKESADIKIFIEEDDSAEEDDFIEPEDFSLEENDFVEPEIEVFPQ